MADNYEDIPAGPVEEKDQPFGTAGDFAKTFGANALGIGSNLSAASRYMFEAGGGKHGAAISKAIGDIFSYGQEQITDSMNPKTKELLQSELTSDKFWEHPALGIALKATGMVPAMAAIALPGGLMAEAVGATAVAAAAGGALSAASLTDEFYKKLDAKSDDDLQKDSPYYAALRESMDEKDARSLFGRKALGAAPAINFIFGAATTALGPAAGVARKMAGGNAVLGASERGILGRVGIGAAEGVGTNAAQEGVEDYTGQDAAIKATLQKEWNAAQTGNAMLEGGVLGGLFGAAAGALPTGKHPSKAVNDAVEDAAGITPPQSPELREAERIATNDDTLPPKTGAATAPPKPPEPIASVGNPQNAPTRGTRTAGNKKSAVKVTAEPVQVVTSNGPDAAQSAALAANDPAPPVTATEVAAQPEVPPQVAAAANNVAANVGNTEPSAPTLASTPEPTPAPEPAPAVQPEALSQPPAQVAAPLDTGMNTPESPATLREQVKQLVNGERKAVMFPKGTPLPKQIPPGMAKATTPRGVFFFNPSRTSISEIQKLSHQGRENELLGLGPVSKPEVISRIEAGEKPAVVTERTPEGTEVRAAAGTEQTAPIQVEAIEAAKTPGNVVSVENPETTIVGRNKTGGRILRPINDPDYKTNIDVKGNLKGTEVDDEGNKVIKGRNMGPKAKADIASKWEKAKNIVEQHAPAENEANYFTEDAARTAVVSRARSMVKAAADAGLKIPRVLKLSVNKDQISDSEHVQKLRYAEDLVRAADKNPKGKKYEEAIQRFKEREQAKPEEALAARRSEGDTAMRRDQGSVEDKSVTESTTPEGNLVSKEDANQEASHGKIDTEKDAVATKASSSSRGPVRLDDGSEERVVVLKDGTKTTVEAAKAAPNKLDAETRARLIAEYNAKLAKPAVHARVDNAARDVDRNPSEAQKRAGNYAKGHVRVDGMEIAIENPRGSIRSGVGEGGRAWSTKLSDHYGYIKRTEGSDGDHVDVYVGKEVGKSGSKYFIVDQTDARTGEFDEHKVMLGFKSEADARAAYFSNFSDNLGPLRLGNIHEVTPAELKAWLANGDTKRPFTRHALQEAGIEAKDFGDDFSKNFREDSPTVGLPTRGFVVTLHNGEKVQNTGAMMTPDAFKVIDLSHLPFIPKAIANFIRTRFGEVLSDVPVVFVDDENMNKVWRASRLPDQPDTVNAMGLYVRRTVAVGDHGTIFISDRLRNNPVELARTIIHEAVHAITTKTLVVDSKAQRAVRALMAQAERGMTFDERIKHDYAFENEHEFMSEALSDPAFQEILSRIQIDKKLDNYLQMGEWSRSGTLWSRFVGVVRDIVESAVGRKIPGNSHSLMDSVLRTTEYFDNAKRSEYKQSLAAKSIASNTNSPTTLGAHALVRDASRSVREFLERPDVGTSPKALVLRTFDNIAQLADHFWGDAKHNPVRPLHEAIEKMRVYGEAKYQEAGPLIKKLAEARAKNRAQFDEMSSIMHDATVANVHPDVELSDARHAYLGKDTLKGIQPKKRHAALRERYLALPPELKELFGETTNYFAEQQNKMSLGIINNQILKLMGIEDEALAKRIHENTLDEADKERLGDMLPVIQQASELSRLEGVYVPLMRRGDYVVKVSYPVAVPSNGKRVENNVIEFNSRKEAAAFAEDHELSAKVKSVWVDKNNGTIHDDDGVRVRAPDPDSVQKFWVTLQNEHVEFMDSKRAAFRRLRELEGSGASGNVQPRKYEPGKLAPEISSSLHALVKRLEKSEAYKEASPTEKATLVQAINEASLASMGSTRVQSKRLPRRNVQGYSEDIVTNTNDYALSSSRYLAKLEHAPELEASIKRLNDTIEQDSSKSLTFGRRAIANEVLKRVQGDNGFEEGGKFSGAVKRAMSISFIDKLASPAYSIINAMQPGMVTMPWLAGTHGVSRAALAMSKAYKDIGALRIAGKGIAETGRKLKGIDAPDDFIGDIRSRLANDDERAMLDHHLKVGTIDPSAGMEIHALIRDTSGIGGKADAVLGYMEGVTRAMPRAVETINRAATALAAYRLERGRGKSHEDALRYSADAVNSTQFNYSATNAPKLFNHPLGKIAFQFKKYGQGMYQLIGMQVGKAIRNAEPGDRAEAVKTLVGVAATHMAMAGALGLPTEPFKYLVLGANAVGLTGLSWGDVEHEFRRRAASVLGDKGGEVFSRGLPRLINFDLQRMGLDSVTSFGEPRSNKESDVKTWLFNSLAGPVVSLGGDWVSGVNDAARGDFAKAAEKLIPLKAASDSIRAYRQATEGKKSASGRETMSSYSPSETAMRALGFGNAREAEIGAERSAFYSQSNKIKEERSALVNAWAQASPSQKSSAMARITAWNRGKDPEVQIKLKELTAKLKRDQKAASEGKHGILPSKRDKALMERNSFYNTGL